MWFSADSPLAVDVLVERLCLAARKVGDDEPSVGSLVASLHPCDDALDTAPARGAINEFLEAPHLAVSVRGLEARFGGGFQSLDVPAQGRGRGDAENEVDAVRPAPVDDGGTTIVAVAADQDRGARPVAPDRPHEATQVAADFAALGPLGRTQDGCDEAAVAIEYDDGLEAILVMIGVERIVDIEHDPLWNLSEGR